MLTPSVYKSEILTISDQSISNVEYEIKLIQNDIDGITAQILDLSVKENKKGTTSNLKI